MFRLEKIFQVDDSVYINIAIFWKGFAVFLSIYIFSILEFNSIFDLLNYDIYKTSKYFYISLYFIASYLLFSFILGIMKKRYATSFLIFLLNDIVPFVITLPFTLYIFFLLKIDFNIDINISYLFILIICNIFIFRKISWINICKDRRKLPPMKWIFKSIIFEFSFNLVFILYY